MICCCNTHLTTFSGKICDMLNAFVLHQGSVKFVCSLTQLSSYYVIVFFLLIKFYLNSKEHSFDSKKYSKDTLYAFFSFHDKRNMSTKDITIIIRQHFFKHFFALVLFMSFCLIFLAKLCKDRFTVCSYPI